MEKVEMKELTFISDVIRYKNETRKRLIVNKGKEVVFLRSDFRVYNFMAKRDGIIKEHEVVILDTGREAIKFTGDKAKEFVKLLETLITQNKISIIGR